MFFIMYVSPIDHEAYFPLGTREVAVVDSSNHIVFILTYDDLADASRFGIDSKLSDPLNFKSICYWNQSTRCFIDLFFKWTSMILLK